MIVTAPTNPRAWRFTKSHHIRQLLGALQGYSEMGRKASGSLRDGFSEELSRDGLVVQPGLYSSPRVLVSGPLPSRPPPPLTQLQRAGPKGSLQDRPRERHQNEVGRYSFCGQSAPSTLQTHHRKGLCGCGCCTGQEESHSQEYPEQFTTSAKWGEDYLSPLGPLASPCGQPTEPLGTGGSPGTPQA